MSTLTVQNIQGSARSSNTINVASGHVLHAPGHIIQAVTAEHSAYVTTTSSSYSDTGLQATITPKLASSHILVVCSVQAGQSGANGHQCYCRILRSGDSTMIGGEGQRFTYARIEDDSSNMHTSSYKTIIRKDTSHNSTSAQTYKFQHKVASGGGTLRHNDYATGTSPEQSTMLLMEIAQ